MFVSSVRESTCIAITGSRGGCGAQQIGYSLAHVEIFITILVVFRAEKFGTTYVEPTKVRKDRELVLAARKERFGRQGFATGIDLFTEEEQQKRAARAARFNITEPQVRSKFPLRIDLFGRDREFHSAALLVGAHTGNGH